MRTTSLAAIALAALGLPLALATWAGAQVQLQAVTPGALRPGHTVELTLVGENLAEPLAVWLSVPAEVEFVERSQPDAPVRLRVTLDAQEPVGVAGIAVATPGGMSGPLLLAVDDLPSVAANGQNHDPAEAQPIAIPVAVDGIASGKLFDYYRFSGQQGAQVAIEVLSARLGSACDPVVRLLDAEGRELAWSDDDPALGADSRLAYTLPHDGDYLIEVQDNKYASGGRYRLRVGDFPLVNTPYPLGVRQGTTVEFDFAGPEDIDWATPGRLPTRPAGESAYLPHAAAAPLVVTAPLDPLVSQLGLSAHRFDGQAASAARLAVSDLAEYLESEPNDSAETGTSIAVPCAVNGVLQHADDRDYYRFLAAAGQRLTFRPLTRSLGSPALLHLEIQAEDQRVLAASDSAAGDEPPLRFMVPHDGAYYLVVESLIGAGGSGHTYRVEARLNELFQLRIKDSDQARTSFAVPTEGGAVALEIQCDRHGYEGPIELTVVQVSPPAQPAEIVPHPRLQLYNQLIPAQATETRLILAWANDVAPGQLIALRLVGRAVDQAHADPVPVATQHLVRKRWPTLTDPPAGLDGLLLAATGGAAERLFTTRLENDSLTWPQDAEQAEVVLNLKRDNDQFQAPLVVLLEGLPDTVRHEVKREGEGPEESYRITLHRSATLSPDRHLLRLTAYGDTGTTGHLDRHSVLLTISPPPAPAPDVPDEPPPDDSPPDNPPPDNADPSPETSER